MTASNVTWTLKTGWMIATGIVAIGLLLQLIVGPVDWHLFRCFILFSLFLFFLFPQIFCMAFHLIH